MVYVAGRIHSMSNETANKVFFTIPSGYRPIVETFSIGGILVNGTFQALPVQITTTGNVGFYWSASATTTSVIFSACYPISW